MKKLFSIFMMLTMMLSVSTFEVSAQAPNVNIKAAKTRAKELKKEKWFSEGDTPIETALIEMEKKKAQGFRVITGSAYSVEDQNDASFDARDDAFQKVGELGKSVIEGRVASNRQKRNDKTSRNSDAGYDRHLYRELEGVMDAPYLTLFREKNGKFDCRIYYVVQSTLIDKALKNAEDASAKEMENAQKYGDGVSDFIKGGKNED